MASNNTLIIFYDSLNGKDSLYQAIEEYEATILYDYRMINAIAIKIPTGYPAFFNLFIASTLFFKGDVPISISLIIS